MKHTIILFLLIITTSFSSAQQSNDLLSNIPETKEQFIESEKNVLATIAWLENTPIHEQEEKHKEQYSLLLAWLTNSPTVILEINADILTFTKKNDALLLFFMAGWTKYSLEHDYSKDITQGTLAGI